MDVGWNITCLFGAGPAGGVGGDRGVAEEVGGEGGAQPEGLPAHLAPERAPARRAACVPDKNTGMDLKVGPRLAEFFFVSQVEANMVSINSIKNSPNLEHTFLLHCGRNSVTDP